MTRWILSFSFVLSPWTGALYSSDTIGVFSYNTYNLFNATHEEGVGDFQFLPKYEDKERKILNQVKIKGCNDMYRGQPDTGMGMSPQDRAEECKNTDWTEKKYQLKLHQLAKALKLSSDRSETPIDVVGLVEVENESAVKDLAKTLGIAEPLIFTAERGDPRGIRNGLIVRRHPDLKGCEKTPDIDVKLQHSLNDEPGISDEDKKHLLTVEDGAVISRPILEVKCQFKDQSISFFVNHWPAAYHPTVERIAASKTLSQHIDAVAANSDGSEHHFVAMGDFNSTEKDSPHPLLSYLDASSPSKVKMNNLYEDFISNAKSADPTVDEKRALWLEEQGTYYYSYEKVWNRFDLILTDASSSRGSENKSWKAHLPSFTVHGYKELSFQNKPDRGLLLKLDEEKLENSMGKLGYSDHYPVSVELRFE